MRRKLLKMVDRKQLDGKGKDVQENFKFRGDQKDIGRESGEGMKIF